MQTITFFQYLTSPLMHSIYWFLAAFYFFYQPFAMNNQPLSKTYFVSEYRKDINIAINMCVVCGFYGSMYLLGKW